MLYSVCKSIHLIFVISWFAGMFYIFRLFVYHAQNWDNGSSRSIFSNMERKLIAFIILPAATGSLTTGLTMILLNPILLTRHWLWLKLVFVLLLLVYSLGSFWVYKQFLHGRRVFSEKACRFINEVPTLALIAISFLVFLKPEFGQ
jgi:putative membrane protein